MDMDTLPPILRWFINKTKEETKKDPFEDRVIFFIQHLLSDFLHLLTTVKELGAKKEDIFIVGIPYSNKNEVVNKLILEKYWVKTPEYPRKEKIPDYLKEALKKCEKENKKLLIIEDGGDATTSFHEKFTNKLDLCLGAVEQTTSGFEQIKDWMENNKSTLSFPVCSIRNTELKKKLEGPEVGKSIAGIIESILNSLGDSLSGKNVLIIGYGTVGKAIADHVQGLHGRVMIAEINFIELACAASMGEEIDESKKKYIKGADVVIGATGTPEEVLKKEDLLDLKNGCVLANASSKRREIDTNDLKTVKEKIVTKGKGFTRYRLINRNEITLLHDGFPVNFLGESIADEISGVIQTEMLQTAVLITQGNLDPGLYEEPIFEEEEIAKIYYGYRFR